MPIPPSVLFSDFHPIINLAYKLGNLSKTKRDKKHREAVFSHLKNAQAYLGIRFHQVVYIRLQVKAIPLLAKNVHIPFQRMVFRRRRIYDGVLELGRTIIRVEGQSYL